MKLYEIEQEMLSLLDEETGEIADFDRFEELQMEKDKKIENMGEWYLNLMAEADALKEQKQKFADREKTARNKADRIKSYLDRILNGAKFKTTTVNISYRKSEQVILDTTQDPPLDYCRTVYELDKTACKEAIKSGISIPGVSIVEKQNITIR